MLAPFPPSLRQCDHVTKDTRKFSVVIFRSSPKDIDLKVSIMKRAPGFSEATYSIYQGAFRDARVYPTVRMSCAGSKSGWQFLMRPWAFAARMPAGD